MLSPTDFPAFFAEANGFAPFPWQQRLLEEIVEAGRWPETIAVPTGCGKTAVVDIAVFLRALNPNAPQRVFFVVDRRLVVDQAFERAEALAKLLSDPTGRASRQVAQLLLESGAPEPLRATRLRGGLALEDRSWCSDPRQMTVTTSTVDQVGSRLLFRGYGCSESRRPIEAGLLATDSLVIVDEAHMSQPFLDTLAAVSKFAPGFAWCQMSATPRPGGTVFSLDPAEAGSSEPLRRRLQAVKQAELVETPKLDQTAIGKARELSERPGVKVVGVVLNSVAAARRVFEGLRRKSDAVLLIGRVRPHDREQVLERFLPRIRTGRNRTADEPLFVVATQTIEVGADVDFDALVTEAAPLDVLRQRFGRVDRIGELGETFSVIVRNPKKDAPAYGEATAATFDWLRAQPQIDFGALSMQAAYEAAPKPDLLTPISSAPLLLPAHVDAWVQTRPAPIVDPAVAPFLHGPDALDVDEVHLAWRADLEPGRPDTWADIAGLAPPVVHELMPVPIGAARSWLGGRPALVWRGEDASLRDIRPGDTVLLPSDYGGADDFGWAPDSLAPVSDLADLAGRWARVHPRLSAPDTLVALQNVLAKGEDAEPAEVAAAAGLPGRALLSWALYPDRAGIIAYLRPTVTQDDSASLSSRAVLLRGHLAGVAAKAKAFAAGYDEAERIEHAARLHDLGKLDPRFQTLLHGGRESAACRALMDGAPLAKSGEAFNLAEYRRLRQASGYPESARHEALSSRLAEARGADALTLHLIESHHGWARPGFQPWADDLDVSVAFEGEQLHLSSAVALSGAGSAAVERFLRMNQACGPWRVAFLEALLRLADQQQSREEASVNA